MPSRLSFLEAAAVPMAGITALKAVRDDGRLRPGQTVLINGASGGVGPFAVQIARALGGKVTAVCSTGAMALIRSLGADEVIDYTAEEVIDSGRTFDLIVNIGGLHSLRALRRTLTHRGTLAGVGGSQRGGLLGPGSVMTRGALLSPFVSQRLISVTGKGNRPDLETLATMIDAGTVTPVIDRAYPNERGPRGDALPGGGAPEGQGRDRCRGRRRLAARARAVTSSGAGRRRRDFEPGKECYPRNRLARPVNGSGSRRVCKVRTRHP